MRTMKTFWPLLGILLCVLLLACNSSPMASTDGSTDVSVPDLVPQPDLATDDAGECMGASECECRLASLKAVCHFINGWVDDLKCDAQMPSCIAACLRELKRCEDVTCAYCSRCDCAGGDTYFTRCVAMCP